MKLEFSSSVYTKTAKRKQFEMEEPKKYLELDKICRVCLGSKKEMRPIFGDLLTDMLMEFAKVKIENADGWPDKICIQCVHSVSRCYTFKKLVEKSDRELREYISGLMVIVEPTSSATLIDMEMEHKKQKRKPKLKKEYDEMNSRQMILKDELEEDFPNSHLIAHHPFIPQIFQTSDGETLQFIHPFDDHNGDEIIDESQLIHLNVPSSPITADYENMRNESAGDNIILESEIYDNHIQYIDAETGKLLEPKEHLENTIFDSDDVGHYEEVKKELDVEYIDCGNDDVIEVNNISNEDNIFEEIVIPAESVKLENDEEEDSSDTHTCVEYDVMSDEALVAEIIKMQTKCIGPGRYECVLCHQVFRQIKRVEQHMKSHSNWIKANCKRKPQCELCHKTFKGPGMLRMHMKTHEKKPINIPTCDICKKQFGSKTGLYAHKRGHLK